MYSAHIFVYKIWFGPFPNRWVKQNNVLTKMHVYMLYYLQQFNDAVGNSDKLYKYTCVCRQPMGSWALLFIGLWFLHPLSAWTRPRALFLRMPDRRCRYSLAVLSVGHVCWDLEAYYGSWPRAFVAKATKLQVSGGGAGQCWLQSLLCYWVRQTPRGRKAKEGSRVELHEYDH